MYRTAYALGVSLSVFAPGAPALGLAVLAFLCAFDAYLVAVETGTSTHAPLMLGFGSLLTGAATLAVPLYRTRTADRADARKHEYARAQLEFNAELAETRRALAETQRQFGAIKAQLDERQTLILRLREHIYRIEGKADTNTQKINDLIMSASGIFPALQVPPDAGKAAP